MCQGGEFCQEKRVVFLTKRKAKGIGPLPSECCAMSAARLCITFATRRFARALTLGAQLYHCAALPIRAVTVYYFAAQHRCGAFLCYSLCPAFPSRACADQLHAGAVQSCATPWPRFVAESLALHHPSQPYSALCPGFAHLCLGSAVPCPAMAMLRPLRHDSGRFQADAYRNRMLPCLGGAPPCHCLSMRQVTLPVLDTAAPLPGVDSRCRCCSVLLVSLPHRGLTTRCQYVDPPCLRKGPPDSA